MNRIRTRLIVVFAAATLLPLAATLWITKSLLEHSLSLSTTAELDRLSESLQQTGRALYRSSQTALRAAVENRKIQPQIYRSADRSRWPEPIREFHATGESEQFRLEGAAGDSMQLLLRRNDEVHVYTQPVGGPGMANVSREYARARALVERASTRDLRRGFVLTLVILAAAVWIASLIILSLWAGRITRPMEDLTAALQQLASGDFSVRLRPRSRDEVGLAMRAFNESADQLQRSQDRLIQVTRLASWQVLARKMAHEVKNSLTPIRLTMEEIVARKGEQDDRFLEQAAQIVVDEVSTLEKRVRAFSDFAAEPPVHLTDMDINALLDERIAFLKSSHPRVTYARNLAPGPLVAEADEDLVRGVLTNLLENAAHAAGPGGTVLGKTYSKNGTVLIEIHDSGSGLSPHARASLFEPTISFKKAGMGLGLSIARRSALLVGGDINLIEGELGGAAFRVTLPRAGQNASQTDHHR